MEMTREQQVRVNNFVPGFYRVYLFEGTVNHARRLASAGMVEEAIDTLQMFREMSRETALTYINRSA